MKIKIFVNQKASKKKADAVVLIESGDLEGFEVRGFCIFEGKDGGLFVTPPAAKYQGKDGKTKYYHHLRETEEGRQESLHDEILAAYQDKVGGDADAPPADEDDLPF